MLRSILKVGALFLSFGLLASASPLQARQSKPLDGNFNLYVYGENISGLPVWYADGLARMGDMSSSSATDAQSIYFTLSDNSWLAHPNVTGTARTASFTTRTLALNQDSGATGGNVALSESSDAARQATSVFTAYGNYVLINMDNANFYAQKAENGLYSLVWSSAVDTRSDLTAVTVRTVAPSTESVLEGGSS